MISLHPQFRVKPVIRKLIVQLIILFLNFVPGESQSNQPVYCAFVYKNGNYTEKSVYQNNLKTLLKDLTNQSSIYSFYNSTSGQGSDKVYGLFNCRGDLTASLCHECIQEAAIFVVSNCPEEKEVDIWYEQCLLRYANRNFFGKLEEGPWAYDNFRIANASDPDKFEKALSDTMDSLITKVVSDNTANRFATGEARFSSNMTVYCLAQCTPDITSQDCYTCLRFAFDATRDYECCRGPRLRLFILRPSCQVMWDTMRFYSVRSSRSLPIPPPPPPAPRPSTTPTHSGKRDIDYYLIRAGIPAAGILALLLCATVICVLMRKKNQQTPPEISPPVTQPNQTQEDTSQFDMDMLKTATDNFSVANRLGEGGFGVVYRGTLPNGREVAVKRLSERSGPGIEQFSNEANLLARLQHRNLVKLLGFCVDGEEKLLVYEFMPNLSLDRFLFDPKRCIDWQTRFKIIKGIVRGILYLHEDTQPTIIHRDLKSNNVLLDEEMNPKIADFGLATLLNLNQSQSSTANIRGTRGYMAPEYENRGVFSIKSDVYSFGVLLLEIISGQSNSSSNQLPQGAGNLLSRARRLWDTGDVMQLVDRELRSNVSRDEVKKCVLVALRCVQENAADRPTMSSVLVMLSLNFSDIPPLRDPSTTTTTTSSYSVTQNSNRPEPSEFNRPNEPASTNNHSANTY